MMNKMEIRDNSFSICFDNAAVDTGVDALRCGVGYVVRAVVLATAIV